MKAAKVYKYFIIVALLAAAYGGIRILRWSGFFSKKQEKRMSVERTYGMIKPEAVANGNTGPIVERIEKEGFKIVAMKKMHMYKDLAEIFYEVHREKPFFNDLVESISSGPIIAMVLEKDGAIAAWRELMGATNPDEAAEGTLRKLYGTSITNNATHGSDASATAEAEIKLIFPDL